MLFTSGFADDVMISHSDQAYVTHQGLSLMQTYALEVDNFMRYINLLTYLLTEVHGYLVLQESFNEFLKTANKRRSNNVSKTSV